MLGRHRWIKPTAIVLGALALIVAAAFAFGGVSDDKALARSVGREANSAFYGECTRRSDGDWRCTPSDPYGSGGARYAVSWDGDCWTARVEHVDADGPMPRRMNGCVAMRDRYQFVNAPYEAWEFMFESD